MTESGAGIFWSRLWEGVNRSCPATSERMSGRGAETLKNMPKTPPVAFTIEYRDGKRGTILLLNGHHQDFCFAAKIKDQDKPVSCQFQVPPPPGAKDFDALVCNIEKLFESGKSPTPLARTLLTTGMLEQAMESNHFRGSRIETPELDVRYQANEDSGFLRGGVSAPL